MTTQEIKSAASGDKTCNYLTMIGHTCSDINQGALSAILPFLVVGGGYSYMEATMLLFASNVASAIIQPLFGWLGDKKPRPWFMALGVFLAGLGMAGIGYAPNYALVVTSSLVSGLGIAMFHPEGGRVSNLAAGEKKGRGMSVFAVGGNIGFFVGPILCATFLTAFGLRGTAVFLVPAILCAVLLLAFNKRFVALGCAADAAATGNQAREHKGLFAAVLSIMSLRSVLAYGLMAFIPLFLVGNLGQSEAFSSLAISLFSVAGAAATFTSGFVSEKIGPIRLLIVCSALAAAGIAAFTFSTSVGVAIVLTLFLAIVIDVCYPSTVALGMEYLPAHLGMASGLSYGVAVCFGGVAEPFLGLAGDNIGLVPVMFILAGVACVTLVLSVVLKKLDREHS